MTEYIEQARAKEEQAFSAIRDMVESFREDPQKMAEYFAFGAQFYHYSPRNVMLVMKQNPGATYVDSYMGWKERGAHVLKGAKALQILVPVTVTYLKSATGWVPLSKAPEQLKEQNKCGEVEEKKERRYKVGNVFDISQTSFPKELYPELFFMGYPSELHEDICRGLKDFAEEELGCQVLEIDLESISLRGRYVHTIPPVIHLNRKLESTQKLSTLSHELGHALIHHGNPGYSEARKEFEADAFSIMLCTSYGVEITESRKEHLAEHYRTFERESTQDMTSEETGKICEEKMMESFSHIFDIYREHEEKIASYVERYVPTASMGASAEPIYMTEDEFLGEYCSPVCDYMLDKMKFPNGISNRDRKHLPEEYLRRQYAWEEVRREKKAQYRQLVGEGKIIPKTTLQRAVETARSPLEELERVQAARRVCQKRGVDWNTYVLPWDKAGGKVEQEKEAASQKEAQIYSVKIKRSRSCF